MAKSKKKKSTTKRKGLRGLPNDKGKRLLLSLTSIVTANLAHEGIGYLNSMAFMQAAPPDVSKGEEPSKINIKQAGLSGGLLLGGIAGASLIKNEWISEAMKGVAVGASLQVKDSVIKPAIGALDDYLDLYKSNEPLKDLTGGRQVKLSKVKLAGGVGDLKRKFA